MENGKVEDADGHMDDTDLHMIQLQALWAELKSSLGSVVQEVSALQQSNIRLEEKVSAYQRDTGEKILSLRNTLNTLQEDMSSALTQITELSCSQKGLQRDMELLQNTQHSRKFSRGEELIDGHTQLCSQTELSLIQHFISSLPGNQNSNSEQDSSALRNRSRSPVWRERKDSRDLTELNNQELSRRQMAALELLESERVYVSYLSLLLKANINFNGCETNNLKDKRLFPSCLRFLIQQHLELLHLLQERVLKSHWQGIMGDVFLRLTSKESDFLDHYISYLKELPECLSVVSLFSSNSSKPGGLLEGDITGDDTRPSLHTLLLQPVQRVPEYLGLLQSLLRQTESDHPDYYLLLVCVQHLRSFTTQYNPLLQHNQELLTHSHTHAARERTHNLCTHQQERATHTRKELSRSSVKQLYKVDYESSSNYSTASALIDPVHGLRRAKHASVRRYQEWEAEPQRYHSDVPSPISFASDSESHLKSPPPPLHSIPETEGTGSSALADAMGAFLPYGGGDSRCSSPSHSSDSSIDIAFVRCSPSPGAGHQSHGGGRSSGGGVYRSNRGCVSPDSVGMMRPRPLQAVQRKSKSLNGLQMDSIDSHTHQVRTPVHPKLERQSSGKSRLRHSSPQRRHETHAHTDAEELAIQIHSKDTGTPIWEDLKWRGTSEDGEHTPLSERSRKEGKGFRSSFKKLFKKKSTGDSKEKAGEKAEGQSSSELESSSRSNRVAHPGDIDRGTAV
ncbi:rho guanine nucleotide exchange factor 33 isoform X1 [Astyanax mexicanus]|uniref:rho guanine nucleotide exchange factor 33 isoform X1 n=1 Tax=Astyanax mexicanus TaxID=7994 RepID=UPI0020CAB9E9|nr:rho guanine nucleotide exchange factor 33 isoform X1 [Astyanax mexicanus]